MTTLALEYPRPCPYLPEKSCTNLVFELADLDSSTVGALVNCGWRHFGSSWFRPICPECRICDGIAVPVDRFVPSASQSRVLKKNSDLSIEMHPLTVDDEHITLINDFQMDRTIRLGWNRVCHNIDSYRTAFVDGTVTGRELRMLDPHGQIIGIDLIDLTTEGISSVYCYTNPAWGKRSLGTWSILMEIGLAKKLSLPWVHLGLVNKDCPSLAYKAAFGPFVRIKQPELQDAVNEIGGIFGTP